MMHILRGHFLATVHLECDGCGAGGPTGRYRGPGELFSDRVRLRIRARLRDGWTSRLVPDPEAGSLVRADFCPRCRGRPREPRSRPRRRKKA